MSGRSGKSGRSSNFSNDEPEFRTDLHELCDQLQDEKDNDWEVIRTWFSRHSTLEASDGTLYRGRDGSTALHLVCRSWVPLDVVEMLIDANTSALDWEDDSGWLPLHYACHHGVSVEVLELLLAKNPGGLQVSDTKGRNPLHFAVGNIGKKNGLFKSSVFTALTQNGAAQVADKKGMLPLHYACAYGASPTALEVLITAHPKALSVSDGNGFMPLHYAMVNFERPDSPRVVELLLSKDPGIVNVNFDHKQHPLYVLAMRANKLKDTNKAHKEGLENALKSLQLFLDFGPMPTTNFFAALHSLPAALLDKAVVHPKVQELLNDKISRKIPTAVMMLDFSALLSVVITFGYVVIESIDLRADDTSTDDGVKSSKLSKFLTHATL